MRTLSFFLVALGLVACGGSTSTPSSSSSSGSTSDGGAQPSPSASSTGTGSTGTTGPATCETTFQTLCDAAVACSGDEARFSLEKDGKSIGSMSWKTAEECTNFWVYTCSQPGQVRADFDYGACTAAAKTAACVTTSQGKGLVYPDPVCNVNPPK